MEAPGGHRDPAPRACFPGQRAECTFPQGLGADPPPPPLRDPEPSLSITARLRDQLCCKGHIHFRGTRGEDRRSKGGHLQQGIPASCRGHRASWLAEKGLFSLHSSRWMEPQRDRPCAALASGSSKRIQLAARLQSSCKGQTAQGPPPPGPTCTPHQGQAAQRAWGAAHVPQHGILVSWQETEARKQEAFV